MVAVLEGVQRAKVADVERVADVLSRGFGQDPVFAWMFPDAESRPDYTRAVFNAFTRDGVANGDVLIDGDGAGAALWYHVDPAIDTDDEALAEQLFEACGPYIERLGIIDELMKAAHPHDVPHAYLNFLGTIPERQGQGVGGRLLEAKLKEVDAAGLPAYLEATTTRSAELYARYGFEHMWQTIDLPDGPRMYPMWRKARTQD